jgi:hypothetical protein
LHLESAEPFAFSSGYHNQSINQSINTSTAEQLGGGLLATARQKRDLN